MPVVFSGIARFGGRRNHHIPDAKRESHVGELRAFNPALGIGELPGTHHESVDDIMQELLVHERRGIDLYQRLLNLSEGRSVSLEEFARQKIRNEEMHVAEIEKMLRRRGDA